MMCTMAIHEELARVVTVANGKGGVGTVSYTHLDVYKRQLQGRVSVEAREAARAAADELGLSIAAYLEALVLADAERRIVRPQATYRQEAMTA